MKRKITRAELFEAKIRLRNGQSVRSIARSLGVTDGGIYWRLNGPNLPDSRSEHQGLTNVDFERVWRRLNQKALDKKQCKS